MFVEHVVEGGPSHQSGIQRGDRIIRLDGAVVFDKKHTEVVDILKGTLIIIGNHLQEKFDDRIQK